MSQISLHFLPKSLGSIVLQLDGVKHFETGKESAVLERFLTIHDTAGQHLHAVNPFNPVDLKDLVVRRSLARERIKAEAAYLKGCLWFHAKVGLAFSPTDSPRENASPGTAWIVQFGPADTDDVKMALAEGVNELPRVLP